MKMKPKGLICPHCKAEPESWVESSSCSTEFTVHEDNAFEELDIDYYGEVVFYCPDCGSIWDMDFEEIWKGIKANIKKHGKESYFDIKKKGVKK